MDQQTTAELGAIAAQLWGVDSSAFNAVDAVLVAQILDYTRTRPALGRADRVAIQAIVELSTVNGELARTLMAALANG